MTRLLLGEDREQRTLDQLGLKLAQEVGEVAKEIESIDAGEDRSAEILDELGDVISMVAKIAEKTGFSLIQVEAQALKKRGLL